MPLTVRYDLATTKHHLVTFALRMDWKLSAEKVLSFHPILTTQIVQNITFSYNFTTLSPNYINTTKNLQTFNSSQLNITNQKFNASLPNQTISLGNFIGTNTTLLIVGFLILILLSICFSVVYFGIIIRKYMVASKTWFLGSGPDRGESPVE